MSAKLLYAIASTKRDLLIAEIFKAKDGEKIIVLHSNSLEIPIREDLELVKFPDGVKVEEGDCEEIENVMDVLKGWILPNKKESL